MAIHLDDIAKILRPIDADSRYRNSG